MTVGITGASGQLGRRTAELVLERVDPADVVLVSRSVDKLAEFAARGAQVRTGDFDRPETLDEAFAGVDRLLIISTDAVGARLNGQRAAIKAAAHAGVQHVLYTSITRPEGSNPAAVADDHRLTEQALRDSDLGWTMLRNNLYADMQLDGIRQAGATGQLVTNAGDGRVAYVTREDCALVAAAALTADYTGNTVLDVTGPTAYSPADLAELASAVAGRPVEVVAVDDEAYTRGLVEQAGLPEPVAALLASFGTSARLGYGDVVGDAVPRFAGRPATGLAELLGAQR